MKSVSISITAGERRALDMKRPAWAGPFLTIGILTIEYWPRQHIGTAR
jgi:hypothetical protein